MNLADYCRERGRLTEAARLLGTSPGLLHDILSGRQGWAIDRLALACDVLGLDMEAEARRSSEVRERRRAGDGGELP